MRNLLTKAIPIITILIFILIMNSDNFFKHPLGNSDNVPKCIELVKTYVKIEDWKTARKESENLSTAWKKIIFRIQFSAEKDEIDSFDVSLSRILGAIDIKDKANAIIELNEAYEHWDNIGR